VVDLPRLIDPLFNLIMEQADHIIVVMQQELSSVRDAQRLIQVITQDLGQSVDRIIPILNRYERTNGCQFGRADSRIRAEITGHSGNPKIGRDPER